jgi:very-short-patch-repair endonuclease
MRNTKQYMSLPYNPALKERARALRCAGNLSEVLLWQQIKNKQFFGLDFDRQKIIGNYIVDFYCAEKQVVLEIDGNSHDNKADYDAQRDAFLAGLGLIVIHLQDIDVKRNLSEVMSFLRHHPALATTGVESFCKAATTPTTPPLRGTPPKEGNYHTTLSPEKLTSGVFSFRPLSQGQEKGSTGENT